MLSIQDLGLSIMGDSPKSVYILGGIEFGIKEKYIDILAEHIGTRVEFPTVSEVVSLFTQNHIIPLPKQVYVVRYDASFVSGITQDYANKLLSLNIPGVLVLIYETDKDLNKLNKFLPDNTASVDGVDSKHIAKYLKSDFPNLDGKIISKVASMVSDYYSAKTVCRCICSLKDTVSYSIETLLPLFGISNMSTDADLQIAFAKRDFVEFHNILSTYDGDKTSVLYLMLRTIGEIDKCLDNKYADSIAKPYTEYWARSDTYNMFNHIYQLLVSLRNGAAMNIDDVLIYLSALFRFDQIPSVEVMA